VPSKEKNGYFLIGKMIRPKNIVSRFHIKMRGFFVAFALGAFLFVGAQQPCDGEFSRCPSGSCALVSAQCNQCAVGEYACPLSNACFTQGNFKSCPGLTGTHFDQTMNVESRLDYLFNQNWSIDELTSQMTDNATEIARLGIPAYVYLNDDQHGVKQPDATGFGNGCSFGASFNTDLLFRIGNAIGVEARGVHNTLLDKSGTTGGEGWPGKLRNGVGLTLYSPNLNLVREPRWGRANEVMSECPTLTGELIKYYVRGLQNLTTAPNPSASNVALTAAGCKHFAAYDVENIPADRTKFNAVLNARDLWETYLPAFEKCVGEAFGQSVMCSYNAVNSVPTCANPGLLTTVLRDHLKFDGFVVSDYDAWANLVETWNFVPTYSLAASVALSAGIDQEGGGGPTYPPVQQGIPAALAGGNLTTARVIESVRRLLRIRIRLGMFNDPSTVAYNSITHASVASANHIALAEEGARNGMTLLKNSVPAGATLPALPLNLGTIKRLALIGPNANASYIMLGSYSDSGCCTTGGIPTVYEELQKRLIPNGISVSYVPGCVNASCLTTDGFAPAAAVAKNSDAVVVVLGMGTAQFDCGVADKTACEAEGYDRPTCALPGGQPDLMNAIRAAVNPGTPVIAVFIHGSTFCLTQQFLANSDAILDAWYPGMRGGAAISDALIGVFSPSGRTAVTWYASDEALPADRGNMNMYPSASSPGITYRFYNPSSMSLPEPIFTFGEGYSYTTFNLSTPAGGFPTQVGPCADMPVSVDVTNSGNYDSDVVVNVFMSQAGASVPSPTTRLVSFTRVFIPAGSTKTVQLPPVTAVRRSVVHDDGGDMFDVTGKRWNEAGTLNFHFSTGAHNSHLNGDLSFAVKQTGTQDISTC
jgi:beta-glucosidase-like glycosyl hydrolase